MSEPNGAEAKEASTDQEAGVEAKGWVYRALAWVERIGNKLPDPAMLFVIALGLVWIASLLLSGYEFSVPGKDAARTLAVQNQLSAKKQP